MEILDFEEINPVTFSVKIKVGSEAIKASFDEILDDLTKDADISGFRPGKAPRNIVLRSVGTDEIWRMARDKSSQQAFGDALTSKKKNSLTAPIIEHIDYSGEGDYEFSAVFYTEPPSPDEILKHAIQPKGDVPNPEDHLPEGMEGSRNAFMGLQPDSWSQLDHEHIVSGGMGDAEVYEPGIGGTSLDGGAAKKPIDPASQQVAGISAPPANPQMYPRLPGNVGNAFRHSGDMGHLPGGLKMPERKILQKPEEEMPDKSDTPNTSPPFRMSKDVENGEEL